MFLTKYIKEVFGALKSLATGMKRTLYYFTHHKEIITQQYPDNRDTLNLPERFKGEVVMPHDENNEHRCTGCTACELACPNGTIKVITKFDVSPDGKKVTRISKEAMDYLMARDWPGNVRELENVVERGVIMAVTDTLVPEDISAPGQEPCQASPASGLAGGIGRRTPAVE